MGVSITACFFGGELVKETIVYVFSVIASLIIAGILWSTTIGFHNVDGTASETGYIGSRTLFKENLFATLNSAATEYSLECTDNYGRGYTERTTTIWSTVTESTGDENIRGITGYSNSNEVKFG